MLMYKVFINEVLVAFTERNRISGHFSVIQYQELNFDDVYFKILNGSRAKINVICDNLDNDWSNFLLNFQVRAAAGGVVKDRDDQVLWIFRHGKWDLPKGHIEKGETKESAALREVKEECNVFGLRIDNELQTTYQIFEDQDLLVMKKTYWFAMHTNEDNLVLIPQKEEGIVQVAFKSVEETKKCLDSTYENIKLLFM